MAFDVFMRQDLAQVIDAVEMMGGDLFTLNAVRTGFGLPIVSEVKQPQTITSTARPVQRGLGTGVPDDALEEFDLANFLWAKAECERQRD